MSRSDQHAFRAPWVARLLLALLLCLGWIAPGATPATRAAADNGGPVRVELTELTPATMSKDSTLKIAGRITNTSDQTITSPQVLLWRDLAPITSREQLNDTLASPANLPIGARIASDKYPNAYTQNLPAELAPKQSLEFSVSAPAEAFGFTAKDALYLVGVHVRGVFDQQNQTVGRARTLVPYETGNDQTVPVTDVVTLSSRPSLAEGVFSDDHLSGELADGGRLDALLDAASAPGVSVAIDPATLDEVEAMTQPYRVRGEGGTVVDGTGQDVARDWLSRWEALSGDRWRLPWASPDIASMAHNDQRDLVGYAARATTAESGTDDLPTLVVPAGGGVDAATLRVATTFEPDAVLAAGLAAPVVADGDLRLVNIDATAFGGGPGPDPVNTAVQIRQRMLADTMVAALAGSKAPIVRVIDTTAAARAVQETDSDHVRSRTLSDLLAATSATKSDPPSYPEALRAAELTPLQLTEADELAHAYRASADLQVDSDAVKAAADRAVGRATSSWWRGMDKSSRRWVRAQADALQEQLGGADVRILPPRPFVMAGRDGLFPITITNKLDVPVKVSVKFTADNPQRLRIPSLTEITVGPGESVTRNIAPHATANGTYLVRAQLTTSSGISIGRAASITVQASNIGKAGWIIVVGSGIVLLGGTVLRIRQVRRYGKGTT